MIRHSVYKTVILHDQAVYARMVHLHDQAAALPEARCRLCNHVNGLFLSLIYL
jgi:hypothetical protein